MGFEPTEAELSARVFITLSDAAARLWLRAGFWSAATGDRTIDGSLIKSWLSNKRAADELVFAGLWGFADPYYMVPEPTPKQRSGWDKSAYIEVYERDGRECRYCYSAEKLTIDHVIPRSKGGDDAPENLVVACNRCNARKGGSTPEAAGMTLLPSRIAQARDELARKRAEAGRAGGRASAQAKRSFAVSKYEPNAPANAQASASSNAGSVPPLASPSPSRSGNSESSSADSPSFQLSSEGSEPSPARAPKPKTERRKARHALPDGWVPNEKHIARANELRLPAAEQANQFRAHAVATGRLMANWDAAFTMWLDRAVQFGSQSAAPFRNGRPQEVSPNVDYESRRALEASRRVSEFLAGSK